MIIGKMVIYSLNEMCVKRGELEEELEKYHVPLYLLPKVARSLSIFKRITSAIPTHDNGITCRELSKKDSPEGTVIRVFEKQKDDLKIGIRDICKGEENIPIVKHIATVFFNKETNELHHSVLSKEGEEIVNRVYREYEGFDYCLSIKEVRSYILRGAEECYGVSMRENGGVFFIPKHGFDLWNRIKDTLKNVKGVHFTEIEVVDSNENRRTIYLYFAESFKAFYKDAIKKAKEYQKIDCINVLLSSTKKESQRVMVYGELLRTDLSGLLNLLNDLGEKIKGIFSRRKEDKDYDS